MNSQDFHAFSQKLNQSNIDDHQSLKNIDETDLYDLGQVHQKAALYQISMSSQDVKSLNEKLHNLRHNNFDSSPQHFKSQSLSTHRPHLVSRHSFNGKQSQSISRSKSPIINRDHEQSHNVIILKDHLDHSSLNIDHDTRNHPQRLEDLSIYSTTSNKRKQSDEISHRKSSGRPSWYEQEEEDQVLEDFLFGNHSLPRRHTKSKQSIILDYEPERGSFEIPFNGKTLANAVLNEIRGSSFHNEGRSSKLGSRKESFAIERILNVDQKENQDFSKAEEKPVQKTEDLSNNEHTQIEDWKDIEFENCNANYAKVIRLEDDEESRQRKKSWNSRYSWNLVHPSESPSNIILGLAKFQLAVQQILFRNSNSSFQTLKTVSGEANTVSLIETTLNRINHSSQKFSFTKGTCMSLMLERPQEVHLFTSTIKNVVNRRLQDVFHILRTAASFQRIKYEASITSGAIILSKLFGARQRSLGLQCFSVWKVRHCLQKQRNIELAAKESEIQQLSREKDEILLALSKAQEKRLRSALASSSIGIQSLGEEKDVDKENNKNHMISGRKSSRNSFTTANTKSSLVTSKKSSSISEEQRVANQILYSKLKALYEQEYGKMPVERSTFETKQSSDQEIYQMPFVLGQPQNNWYVQGETESRPPLKDVFNRRSLPSDLEGVRSSLAGALHRRCDKDTGTGSYLNIKRLM